MHCQNIIFYRVVLVEVLICEMFSNAFNAHVICMIAVIFCCYFVNRIRPENRFLSYSAQILLLSVG